MKLYNKKRDRINKKETEYPRKSCEVKQNTLFFLQTRPSKMIKVVNISWILPTHQELQIIFKKPTELSPLVLRI